MLADRSVPVTSVEHDLRFYDGGRRLRSGTFHVEGEVWDVSHPTEIIGEAGRTFEFAHAWAENFIRLTCDGQTGLAHFECVVITD